ncbi:MAG: exodeoxyribonuclease III [Bifidobacteriaceae bacterium]|nr:exodeoxyribonuclease III [Bifidobacteriaceae bacterium]
MKIATWNINSVRARLQAVLDYLAESQVDVLALQETKVKDAAFPEEPFQAAGYQVAHWGLNQWNGVAIASRVGLADVAPGFPGQPAFGKPGQEPVVEARALGATCGGVRIWSLYVPHGRSLEDPHMVYKLAFLERLRQAAAGWLADDPDALVALVGDWNVVPLDTDVWDMAAFDGATHVSAPERAAFQAFAGAGYSEVTRQFLPQPHTYTYWDYQQLRFRRNQGMRIDFAWCSPALTAGVAAVQMARDQRKRSGASDHIPVEVVFLPNRSISVSAGQSG